MARLSMSALTFSLDDLRQRDLAKYVHHWELCRCGGGRYRIRAVIARNGVHQYKVCCAVCRKVCGGAIAHDKLEAETRTVADETAFNRNRELLPPCEHCGDETSGVELHHWAPFSVFDLDAANWPTSYLCRKCHRLWHSRISGRKIKEQTP